MEIGRAAIRQAQALRLEARNQTTDDGGQKRILDFGMRIADLKARSQELGDRRKKSSRRNR